MNNDIDELLCLLDGKITVYRMKHPHDYIDDIMYRKLIKIQSEIHKLWDENRRV